VPVQLEDQDPSLCDSRMRQLPPHSVRGWRCPGLMLVSGWGQVPGATTVYQPADVSVRGNSLAV
jgi:hypothetical protein